MLVRILFIMLIFAMLPTALAEGNVFDTLRGMDIEISEDAERGVRASIDEMAGEYEKYLGQGFEFGRDSDIVEVLCLLGSGKYDPETDTITPWTDSVYAFDVEMTWIEEGYALLLDAVARMSGGGIDIEDVSVEIGEAALAQGWGQFPLKFTMNGEPCEFALQLQTDWMDLHILDELNRELVKRDPEKKLWFTYDGGQGIILFYRDKAWVDRFQQATGLELADVVYQNPVEKLGSALWGLFGG